MKLYAELPRVKTQQILADALTAAWTALWIWVGMRLHDLVALLTEPGERVEEAGERVTSGMLDVAQAIGDTPLVGGGLRAPFDALAEAGGTLAAAGRSQQEVVLTIALWLGVIVAVVPILLVLQRWVPWRAGWIREATHAAALRDQAADLRLFAHRAVATRSLRSLRRASDDPGRALAEGRYEALAKVELEALGLRATR